MWSYLRLLTQGAVFSSGFLKFYGHWHSGSPTFALDCIGAVQHFIGAWRLDPIPKSISRNRRCQHWIKLPTQDICLEHLERCFCFWEIWGLSVQCGVPPAQKMGFEYNPYGTKAVIVWYIGTWYMWFQGIYCVVPVHIIRVVGRHLSISTMVSPCSNIPICQHTIFLKKSLHQKKTMNLKTGRL